jgi:hypothetical protein
MHYLAEFYLPPRDGVLAELAGQASRGARLACAGGTGAEFVRLIYVPQDESCFALYLAGSAEAVTIAGRLAGITFDRVVAALIAP